MDGFIIIGYYFFLSQLFSCPFSFKISFLSPQDLLIYISQLCSILLCMQRNRSLQNTFPFSPLTHGPSLAPAPSCLGILFPPVSPLSHPSCTHVTPSCILTDREQARRASAGDEEGAPMSAGREDPQGGRERRDWAGALYLTSSRGSWWRLCPLQLDRPVNWGQTQEEFRRSVLALSWFFWCHSRMMWSRQAESYFSSILKNVGAFFMKMCPGYTHILLYLIIMNF